MCGWAANKKQMSQFPAGLMVKGHMTVHTGSMGKGDLCFELMDFSFKCQRVSYLSQNFKCQELNQIESANCKCIVLTRKKEYFNVARLPN